ncbi:MAG TPA: lipoprotein [Luteimonas sp.]|nr:lipoprotein [Luteimonas sp.]
MNTTFLFPLLLVLGLSACGNKGALIMPPATGAVDAEVAAAPAVQDAGAEADPIPADRNQSPLPPAVPPIDPATTQAPEAETTTDPAGVPSADDPRH